MNDGSTRDEVAKAIAGLGDTPFDSLSAEVEALEKAHELLQARLSAAGE